ncbi:hypothetical protein A9168_09920 [Macellibacteroides sp. HH-ZS]|nr:hypothetical protein A9168_09920 [Macellibacteroides sp. HH-ZS]
MFFIEIILLSVGLSMDSLAASVTTGSVIKEYKRRHIFRIASIMAMFQAGMTLIGYFAGIGFSNYICSFDHWIAFFLLLYIGGKMVYEELSSNDEDENCKCNPLCNKTICCLAIATSIDALAVGISLALISTGIMIQALTIGLVTFAFSAFGVYFGGRFGRNINLRLELIGGVILILIGFKILSEHLFF